MDTNSNEWDGLLTEPDASPVEALADWFSFVSIRVHSWLNSSPS